MTRHPSPQHLVLVGMMGGGKSTVGALLADRLERPFVDLDGVIEATAGAAIAAQFASDGEAAFRARETDALRDVLAGDEPVVLATGGGVVLAPENATLLASGPLVVWLRARPETLADRVGDGVGRPLLADDPEGPLAVLRRLEAERAPCYAAAAEVVIDVDHLTPAQIVDEVIGHL